MTATIAPPTTPIVGVVPPGARVTLGSFFSGFGGLDMAVEEVFDAETLWLSDIDPGACKVLDYRFPHIPNLGDITTIKWTPDCPTCGIPTVAVWVGDMGDRAYRCADHGNWPLDIATGDNPALVDMEAGGSPCQDVSTAGARAGMVEGTRSNLWQAMREGIYRLQPALVVWENVAGVLSAKAASQSLPEHLDAAIRHHLTVSEETRYDIVRQRHRRAAVRLMESRQGHVGVPYPQPALRALGRVLGDMASLGFDAEWGGIQASDVGAPHGRKREFVLSVHPARARILARRLEAARQAIRAW